VNIPEDHPRYRSLMTRERLARAVNDGLVTPTGMISHGRGEAFDYLMGERTTASALMAQKAATAYLLKAANPVVCVNGNAAALDPERLIRLAEAVGAKIEVNIFHRTEERMELLIAHMERMGAKDVLGRDPDARIPGLSSDRALCTGEGIFTSDVILVPIEDGDRAQALAAMGKIVIAIDLNPLSRTSAAASVSIADEMSRALENMIGFSKMGRDEIEKETSGFDNASNRRSTAEEMCRDLRSQFEGTQ
jgi:4-phosphopantoate--beta-alanine ligase